ncbi:MAG TPA: hypothetical protein PKD53_02355 [Chloroflexaceae bacterium]|nr:hypothetical protein [Chloroflexaceae bacterium]
MRSLLHRVLLPALVAGVVAAGLAAPTTPARASITPIGQTGCPDGQVVGGANLVRNGDFRIPAGPGPDIAPAAGFSSQLPNRGPGVYPSDGPEVEGGPAGGGFSIQTGPISYRDDSLIGRPFPGDPSREVPPAETYFYSNPNTNLDGVPFFDNAEGGGYLWRQTVAVAPNTTYNFYAYFDNLLTTDSTANDPVIELRVDDPADAASAITVGAPITVTKAPDIWVPIQLAFLTGPAQTEAVLEIWDVTGRYVLPPDSPTRGDDFAMTAINLRPCAAAVGVAKAAAAPVRKADGSYDITYTITVRNYGTGLAPITDLQIVDDLVVTFADAGSFRVTARSGSANVTINNAFTGVSPNTRLLAGGDTLAANEQATISFTVNVTPGPGVRGRGPFPNRAIVTARSSGILIEDDSVPGNNPDLNENNNPKDPEEDDDTVVNIGSKLGLPFISMSR